MFGIQFVVKVYEHSFFQYRVSSTDAKQGKENDSF